ncbi:MAG: ATP-binding protein [Woeseiaceae bacterium]|nr:ATP-binding protein [Woeseiaceae bacterium]
MNLRRQLLLVSLLTLILPWAGCQFVRETESALREGQQQMLSGTALAIADSLSQFPYELLTEDNGGNRIYAHPLRTTPLIDGYVDDWTVPNGALHNIRGADGPIRYVFGQHGQYLYLFVDVRDTSVVYADTPGPDRVADEVSLLSIADNSDRAVLRFVAEAPGRIVATRDDGRTVATENRVEAHWQDTADGYQLEARIPRRILGSRLGLAVLNTPDAMRAGITSTNFEGATPGRVMAVSPVLQSVAAGYVQPGWRLMITNNDGWRMAQAGSINTSSSGANAGNTSGWMRLVYQLVLEPGADALLAEPAPSGRESQSYISEALQGEPTARWFRSPDTDRAVISVAQPIWSGTVQTGVLILQHGTDAILSQTNEALTRLLLLTLTSTVAVAIALLGYASWLSIRIRTLSEAAEQALDQKKLRMALPSALAGDEIGDLSRSFSSVLRQLGIYNDYLQSLASKLSHELRTPLTIVRSSLENLEHENLSGDAKEYTKRAREGTARLQRILSAMSEASRTEELIENAELENFNPGQVLKSVVNAYADAWPARQFAFSDSSEEAQVYGAPELIIQMLDKLVDNAVDFTKTGDTISISMESDTKSVTLAIENPGAPLPMELQSELFDSMVSVRKGDSNKHLGLGLYIARLIAEGHNGGISANNMDNGVRFSVSLPRT